MRYFKLIEFEDSISIWALREDGYEKCLGDISDPELTNKGTYKEFRKPIASHMPLDTMSTSIDLTITELTEDEAFLELI